MASAVAGRMGVQVGSMHPTVQKPSGIGDRPRRARPAGAPCRGVTVRWNSCPVSRSPIE